MSKHLALAGAALAVLALVAAAPAAAPLHEQAYFVRHLGEPTNGSCSRIAHRFGLDPDAMMLARYPNGDASCLIDDVTTGEVAL